MPVSKFTDDEVWRTYEAKAHNAYATAEVLGIGHSSCAARIRRIKARRSGLPVLPTFPDPEAPIEEIRARLSRDFQRKYANKQAKRWFEVRMPQGPFGLMLWGDPHLDSNGCNWPLLELHCEIARQPGIYSINIGDTLDNWPHGSRLMALYAKSDQSVETGQRLARWFFEDAGIYWLLVLLGNHDVWPGHTNMRQLVKKPILMEDWGARFILSSGDQKFRVWASHDFPGNSMHNSLHGLQRAAHTKEHADLYVAGHKHNWALHQEESASRGFCYWLARARGYKYIDDHAEVLGHDPQQEGASILAVFRPDAKTMAGRVTCFSDVEAGADYLRYLRAT